MKGYRGIVLAGVILSLFCISWCLALEPPRVEQLARYRSDGSFAARIDDALALGNHRVSPPLAQDFAYRLRRCALLSQGLTEREIDAVLTPPPSTVGMPRVGHVKIFALLIEFSDLPHIEADTPARIAQDLFGEGHGGFPQESLRNFYLRSSYGQLDIQGQVLDWYDAGVPRDEIPQTATGRRQLIEDAIAYHDAQGHDFSQYDADEDGVIDFFVVIWTGPAGEWASFWWGYQTHFGYDSFVVDGKTLRDYSWQWESSGYPGGSFSPDVVIHETGHALGLPDYYDYFPGQGPDGGVGGLDQMDANWGDHNCFSKFLLDWISPQVVSDFGQVMALNASGTSSDAVVVMPQAVPGEEFGEFFMVQNRHRVANGNDVNYPGDGLLVWHVDSTLDLGIRFKYDNSRTAHKLLRLMEADGLEEIEQGLGADAGDYYQQGHAFSPLTQPSSVAYDGSRTNVFVQEVSDSGPSMTAFISVGPLPQVGPLSVMTYQVQDAVFGNDNGLLDCGEDLDLVVSVQNPGNTSAEDVVLTLTSTDGFANILNAQVSLGSIPGSGIVPSPPIPIALSLSTPHQHLVEWSATISAANGGPWSSVFSVPVNCISGVLVVNLLPSQAVMEGAQWRINQGAWHQDGDLLPMLPQGTYEVSFRPLPDWAEPRTLWAAVTPGQLTQLQGEYEEGGWLNVELWPERVNVLGAAWTPNALDWYASGDWVLCAAERHAVSCDDLPQWVMPPSQNVAINSGDSAYVLMCYWPACFEPALLLAVLPGWPEMFGMQDAVDLINRPCDSTGPEIGGAK